MTTPPHRRSRYAETAPTSSTFPQAYADAPKGRKQGGRDQCAPPAIACKPRANYLKPKEIHPCPHFDLPDAVEYLKVKRSLDAVQPGGRQDMMHDA
jgi:hypothetical protein